jgi:hypothetical protein
MSETIRIHALKDGAFSLSAYGCWFPGCYADEATARRVYALDPTGALAQRLQDQANARADVFAERVIAAADVIAELAASLEVPDDRQRIPRDLFAFRKLEAPDA